MDFVPPSSDINVTPSSDVNVVTPSSDIKDFVAIAQLIAGADAPPWLSEHLRRWIGSLFVNRGVEQRQPTRAEMRKILAGIETAATTLSNALASPPVLEFLGTQPLGPIRKREDLSRDLADLASRAKRAADFKILVTAEGVTKAGRGKALLPGTILSRAYCALIVAETWKHFHDSYPSRSLKAAAAAEALWRAAAGNMQHWGDEPLNCWRYHFQKAREHAAEKLRAEYRRHLLESERLWKLLSGVPG